MSYVDQNLLPGEEVTYRGRLHRVLLVAPIVILILALLPVVMLAIGFALSNDKNNSVMVFTPFLFLVAIALAFLLARWLRLKTSEFAVTNKRVLVKVGVLRRRSLELLLPKVEGIGVDQGLMGRWLGYGTIVVTGTGGTREQFRAIANPLEFRKQVQTRVSE